MPIPDYTAKDVKRFWSKVAKSDDPDACWLWTAGTALKGYGLIRWRGRQHMATHVSYELAYGVSPGKLFVLHTCDTPACCNPKHLFLGTQQDNMRDMALKQRKAISRGEQCSWSKLSDQDVEDIRQTYARGGVTMQDLADRYHLSNGYVCQIIHRNKRR